MDKAQKYELSNSVRHSTDSEFIRFLNIITQTVPTQSKIETVLSGCFIAANEIEDYVDNNTNILCTHCKNVAKHTKLVLRKNFSGAKTRKVMI